ncbi:MAG TPA: immunoglobulin domain-containing protein [Verrucomicrobiota bacterium]|nr:immunoglobulin domain-containing protein [Verrucomicrobiota bacterium]
MKTNTNKFYVVIISIIITLITSNILNAALLEYEGFDYIGTAINGQNGGQGWTNAWSDPDNDTPLSNDGVSLTFPKGVYHIPQGSRVVFTTVGEAERRLGAIMDLSLEGNVFYFSALAKRNGDFRFNFIDDSGNIRWRMGGQSANNAAVLGVSADYTTNGVFPAGETIYLVGKLITHSSANDQVYLNIYRLTDTVPGTEPATWMTSTNGGSGVKLTRFQITNASNAALEIDEIRIGTNYQEVVIGTPQEPIIIQQPLSTSNYEGLSVNFSVEAVGATPLFYQWQKDGIDLSLQTNKTLILTNIQTTDAGSYTVIVSNSFGATTSEVATLTVIPITGIETGLQAKWSLDETTGLTAYDSGPYQLNGTLNNYPPGDSQWVKGKINGGLMFYGTNYIEVSDNPKIGANLTRQFSIATWINSSVFISTNGNTYRCFEKGDNIF